MSYNVHNASEDERFIIKDVPVLGVPYRMPFQHLTYRIACMKFSEVQYF